MGYRKENGVITIKENAEEISYCVLTPDAIPKAILQTVSFDAENPENSGFIEKMTDNGIIVCGMVLTGRKDERFPKADMLKLVFDKLREKYRHLPLILYGTKEGSYIARDYVTSADGLDGVILTETPGLSDDLKKTQLKLGIKTLFKGKNTVDPAYNTIMQGIFGNQHEFTLGEANDLLQMIPTVTGTEWAAQVRSSLPVLTLTVGDISENGIFAAFDDLESSEMSDVRNIQIPESEKDTIPETLIEWINEVCDGVAASLRYE